ncbi:coenzyme Q3 homolog, methyltransferase (yeast) [Rattus norvegicus]|uniref:Ubiquinone biosynthesis O-methyltransferase, mitochondrial n=3 Tax=Rattus norvegicus TaxID=10116 RepID=COQ3_RAT|nr:ubiquinone biosynthesis O-methyltransferase, mitochondrial isoform X1 [Rattus norvegicus]Q63159.2 RecName: Full=Ubiquinone biosynthesis O-methyltransferase, mitochondrial; AltName: Full=3-demethylubiquinol 3-O-methyltransferase; AltName: Full=Polyprenyldihydroxybenzoate methyltransferase; Flags: Precursor [Rattus norvegicus]AAI26095.1 Coq3 protein [Rattus norvegicus]EDL98525.1 coenzyme Q3 homolog, methyltransferase (yeast) [Rattus norvegicus]|eukprot:XP_017448690.1 PREDICTED: ubiquinone biosynthesis O-methyltransferase, mitochondrial isoform X1 [Rattus norvegicus]
MWRGGRLSSRGVRFLETLGFACPSAVAEPPRVTSWTAFSGNQLTRNLQIKPWEFSGHRTMWLRSYRITFSCLTRLKTYRSSWKKLYSTSQTVDSKEVKTFQALAHSWWDEQGKFAPLHSMNDLRVPFIRDNLLKTSTNHDPGKPLSGMKILDVGCGGGLLTEPLGRLGASVVGIDPVAENIKIAQHHKSFDPVLDKRIQYRVCSLEETLNENAECFDAVVASEVVEHVNNLEMFIQCCYQVLKPGGSLFITTVNKTQLSYVLGIVFSEQIAGIVPKGTHTWEKFVSPEKLESILEPNGLSVETVAGMVYNPFSGYWHWTENTSLNYAAHAVRARAQEHLEPAESA